MKKIWLLILFIALIASLNSDSVSAQTVQAPCSSPNIGCAQGGTCVVDPNNPANNYCQGGIQSCGDNNKDCFDDCTYTRLTNCDPSEDENKLISTLGSLVLVLLFVIMILIILMKQKKTIKKR